MRRGRLSWCGGAHHTSPSRSLERPHALRYDQIQAITFDTTSPSFKSQGQIQVIAFDTTSPSFNSTQAHTSAEVKLATWKRQYGIARTPATSGTEARSGPKKRPMKMPGTPQRVMKRSPRGSRSGWRDSGQTCATDGPSLIPIQYDSQSPSAAPSAPATQTGQKLMPVGPIR